MSDLLASVESADDPGSTGPSTAQFGVIVFLASDVMLFAPFFAAYFLLRSTTETWPPEGVELAVWRTAVATALLVASSFTMMAADRAGLRAQDWRAMRWWLLATITLGAIFLANQLAEYATLDFRADDHPYGSIYWLLTGLHGAHVTAGLGALVVLLIRSVRARSEAALVPMAEGVSLFWHLVDIIWLFVFATIWLLK